MREDTLRRLAADMEARRPVALLTLLGSGEQRLIYPDSDLPPELAQPVAEAFRRDRSTTLAAPEGEAFLHVFNPPLRMIIIGAVHVSQYLLPLARSLGYDVVIIDPRTGFANTARFPDVALVTKWPDEALVGLALDRRTAFIALTHDPKIDDPALTRAVASDCFYIGALGSSRTHAKRLARLGEQGVAADALARIHAPIGLDIGAQGPAEIALSIMAEVTAALRGKPTGRR